MTDPSDAPTIPPFEDPQKPGSSQPPDGSTTPMPVSRPSAPPPPFRGQPPKKPTPVGSPPVSRPPVSRPPVGSTPASRPPQPDPASSAATPPSGRPVQPSQPAPRRMPPPPPGATSGQGDAPLPRRVSEVDREATQVTPVAYTPASNSAAPRQTPPAQYPARPPVSRPPGSRPPYSTTPPISRPIPGVRPTVQPVIVRRAKSPGLSWGCVLRALFAGLFGLVVVALCIVSLMFVQYYRIASTLPDIADLQQRASQFETTRILDRDGHVLYEILDPNAGRRTYVPLAKISPYLVAATIATEDKAFYSHPGFNLMAILRAFWQNYQSGGVASGASTITQQLARTLLFTPEERVEQSYDRKLREAILAAEITRRYTKDEILELYLNENYYSNLSYGVEAAAETYFGATVDKLTLGQAAFLAGLPQSPGIYDVYTSPDLTFKRFEDVLVLMYEASTEEGCIYVSNYPERVCVDALAVTKASEEIKNYAFKPPSIQMRYPHWVTYVRSLLEAQFDAQTIYRSGFSVYTTLAPGLQDVAQQAVREQVDSMAAQRATDGALVILRPSTGEILAMVGSADFYNEAISGEVNMAISPRQPGSSIKPLTYLAAFEKNWTPATLLWDVHSEFPPSGVATDPRDPYKPVNYDGRFHGPVTVRYALANSYNIPAVKTLSFVGIYDDPSTPGEDGFISLAKRMGISTLTRSDYGLSLTLGGGEVTLLELTGAYATIANGGRRMPAVAITRILDHSGAEVYKYPLPAAQQVIREEHAYLMASILSDNQARTPAFGANSVLKLPFAAAVKTGTTNDYRDNWTLGFTPDVAVGVWVGNADYTPMNNTTGLSGAAPIWAKVMQAAVEQVVGSATPFVRPPGIVEMAVCEVSGTLPSQWCPQQRSEVFAANQPPLSSDKDLWQKAYIDTWTGMLASPACPDFTSEQIVLNVTDEWAKKWIRKDSAGQSWAEEMGFDTPVLFAPSRECQSSDPRPRLVFLAPRENDEITTSPLGIYAIVDASNGFDFARLDVGLGDKPVEWNGLVQTRQPISEPDLIFTLNVAELPAGRITLRLYMESEDGHFAETFLHLNIQVPTPTPEPTPEIPIETPWWPLDTPDVLLPPTSTTEP